MFYCMSFCLICVYMLLFKRFILKNTLKTRGVKKSFAFFFRIYIHGKQCPLNLLLKKQRISNKQSKRILQEQ